MEPSPTFSTIVLDYGHGGLLDGVYQTAGKRYRFTDQPDEVQVLEGVVNRRVAVWLAWLLADAGVAVFDPVANRAYRPGPPSWRDLEQTDVSLSKRVSRANALRGPSLYLSIHSNALSDEVSGPSVAARGTTFWTSPGRTTSDAVATSLHAAFSACPNLTSRIPVRTGDLSDGDIDHEARFCVLEKTTGSAVVGEVGFYTNIHDARALLDPACQALIADCYLTGLKPWLKT